MFPVGVLAFTVGGLAPGASVDVTIDLPVPAHGYWKLHGSGSRWSQYRACA